MGSGGAGDDDVLVLPPLPADPLFVDAVEDAVTGGSDDLPDAQPARRIGADTRDFASLYIRHRASFGLHARRFLHDPRDVEEVLQEAFLRLFLAMPELDTELQALAYCRRTVTNLCIDRYRADQRRPRLVDLDAIDWDPSDEQAYDDPVLRAEDAAIVRQALALLTPMHRAALVKREIEEKPLPQIAEELGIPEESVKHLLHRARRALRRLLIGTSVEPGADLSNTEILRLANERLARATLRSTNVLIVLFVAAVAVVGGLRDLGRRSGSDAVKGGSAISSPARQVPSPSGFAPGEQRGSRLRTPAKAPRTHGTTHAGPSAPAIAQPTAPVVPPHTSSDHWTSVAVHHHGPGSGSRPVAPAQPAYRLTGVVASAGPAAISHEVTLADSSETTAVSRFVAPLRGASFALDQTLVLQPAAAPVLQLQASVSLDSGREVSIALAAPAPAVTTSDGTIAVAGFGASADGATSVNVLLVYDASMSHVLSETVGVAQLAMTDGDTASASSPTSPSSDTTLPEVSSTAGGSDPAAMSSSGSSEVGGFSQVPSTTPLEGGGGLIADR